MIYLLDSNVWIDLLRGSSPALATKFQALAPRVDIRVCSVVCAELWYGCAKSAKPEKNRTKLDMLLAPFSSLPYDNAAAQQYVEIRRELELKGQPIGSFDTQIAAIALANGCTLVTHNLAEFGRVSGLLVEDWQIP